MFSVDPDLVFLIVCAPLMVATAVYDLRQLRIPNWLVLAVVGAFLATAPFVLPWVEVLWRILFAVILLVLGILLYQVRQVGGGDVKMLAAAALYVSWRDAPGVAFLLALMLVVMFLTLFVVKRLVPATGGWRALERGAGFPLGVAISGAMIVFLAARYWLL